MCIPAGVIAAISLGTTVLSTAMSISAANQQAAAAQQQSNFQAAVSRNNAILSNQMAADALKRGALEERRQRLRTSKLKGAQRAAFGASNVALDVGSPLDVLEDTAGQGELDALIIRNNAEREAVGFRFQAQNQEASANLSLLRGSASVKAGQTQALSSLIGGATQFSDKFISFKQKDVF